MPAPVVAMINTTPAASSTASTGHTLSGTNSGNGLFTSLLANTDISPADSAVTQGNQNAFAALFGGSGFSLSSNLLVLPQELATMSPEDLKALLAKVANTEDGTLSNAVLVSLTIGTPAADAIANFLAEHGAASAADTSFLTTTGTDASAQGNVLLVATGLSPSDIEELKTALKALQDETTTAANLKDALDASAAETAAAFALVMFIPAPAQADSSLSLDAELNLLSLSKIANGQSIQDNLNADKLMAEAADATSLTKGQTLAANQKSPEDYQSPFDMSSTDILLSLSDESPLGFQGSLKSASAETTTSSESAKAVLGKMDAQAIAFGSSHIPSSGAFSNFNESSALMTNGQSMSSNTSSLTNPLINNPSAATSHPATQMVALMVEKSVASGKTEQTLSIQLDPPELGRVQVQLSLEKGDTMKVHVLAENKDTLSLLQRDSHTLRAALDQAGIQTDNASLSFDMAGGDQSFNQMLGGSQDGNSGNSGTKFSLRMDDLSSEAALQLMETKMDFIPDIATGNVHYSLLV